ncbi:MAG TPA: hypothetical protein VJZ71_12950 [Phycisphaerae bacterium]|nr:hypothetical protein [Phycisphaerae bacterium]
MKAVARLVGLSLALPLVAAWAETSPPTQRRPPADSENITVPKIWDEKQLATWATPVAGLGVRPGHFSEEEYYAAPVDNLRTYPVYHPNREPPGYRAWMKSQGPRPLIEPEKLRTKADWVEAGRQVFEQLDTALSRTDDQSVIEHFSSADAIDKYRDATHDVISKDGILLDYRWVVDRNGGLKISLSSCSGCHTRLMPDGSLLPGAPSNFDLSDSPAANVLLSKLVPTPRPPLGKMLYAEFGVPWLTDDTHARFKSMSDPKVMNFRALETGEPPGTTFSRLNGSPYYTTRMADLNGVKDRRYLDATGTHANRGPADIARYGILVEFADIAVFGPHRMIAKEYSTLRLRPPDEAMYALGLYVYSLEPPKSPFPFDEQAQRGKSIFEAEGCTECHTPPVYTNNKLVAVSGFEPPVDDPATFRLDISTRRVGTDPGLALKTRKGTGYYKIPSLRGLWYRGLYEHSGSVASLEDWFDPKRLRDDYVPSGWKGPGVKTRAVPGHKFGHDLSDDDKKALIAFLKTL